MKYGKGQEEWISGFGQTMRFMQKDSAAYMQDDVIRKINAIFEEYSLEAKDELDISNS